MFDWVHDYIFLQKKKLMERQTKPTHTTLTNSKTTSDRQKSGAELDDNYESKWAHFYKANLISLLQTNLIL